MILRTIKRTNGQRIGGFAQVFASETCLLTERLKAKERIRLTKISENMLMAARLFKLGRLPLGKF